jgi:hypothetical protein
MFRYFENTSLHCIYMSGIHSVKDEIQKRDEDDWLHN